MTGAVIVMEPGEEFDPSTDHVFTLGWDGPSGTKMMINGDTAGVGPIEMKLGATHRLRFINIGAAGGWGFAVRKDTAFVRWRRRAKDGADLPPALRVEAPALSVLYTGETSDAEWTPTEAGEYVLTLGRTKPWVYSRKIIVR
jgi:hypothetical protein